MSKARPHAALEAWTWVLIYGGLFLLALGIVAARVDESMGWFIAAPGSAFAIAGIVLIYVRSRLKESQ